MKMLKKLLAVVLTGAMALTLLTACGGNAVRDKDIADAMNDIIKSSAAAAGRTDVITFTPRAKEREMAQKIAELLEKEAATATVADGKDDFEEAYKNILANEKDFVWVGTVVIDELGVSEQAYQLLDKLLETDDAYNYKSLEGKTPADTRYMGSALCKATYYGETRTARVVVVTAPVEG